MFSSDDAPAASIALNARNLSLAAPATVSNGTASSHPEAAPDGGHGLGLSGLFHKIFNRHATPGTVPTLNIRTNGTVTPAGVSGSNGTTPSGASHSDATTEGHGSLGLGGLLHKIFNRDSTPTNVNSPLIPRNGTVVLPSGLDGSNGTTPAAGSSHPDSTTGKGHGLGLGGLLHKIFNRDSSTPIVTAGALIPRNGTAVLPSGLGGSNGTTLAGGSSHPDSATGKGQGRLGLGGLLNKIFGRFVSVPVEVNPSDPADVDNAVGEVGMLMSLNRHLTKGDGEQTSSREERRKNREMRRVRRAMSAAAKAAK